jgi:hypothetical protein
VIRPLQGPWEWPIWFYKFFLIFGIILGVQHFDFTLGTERAPNYKSGQIPMQGDFFA